MPRPLTKPPRYRLTVTDAAGMVLVRCVRTKRGFPMPIGRADGRFDIGITFGLLDQLQTAALPKENLSDTLLRIAPKA